MNELKNELFIFFLILSLVLNSPPPLPQKLYEIKVEIPKVVYEKEPPHTPSSPKRAITDSSLEIMNSTLETEFYDDYKIEKHQIILVAKNLGEGGYYPSYSFYLFDLNTFENIEVSCNYIDDYSNEECTHTETTSKNGDFNQYNYDFTFKLFNEQQLLIKFSHKIKKAKEQILYKYENIRIPTLKVSKFCDYKYKIMSEKLKFLGIQDQNITLEETDNSFTYYGDCPTESITDAIRLSPKISMWKALMGSYLTSPTEFKNQILMRLPRYYRGGKNDISYYRIFSTENEEFKEEKFIDDYTHLKVTIPPANTKKLGVKIHTAFTNKLSDEFKFDYPSTFYDINSDSIDEVIKTKANSIINDNTFYPGKPNYYKIGQFVHKHITYDIKEFGKNYTAKEIYDQQKGICEHYTILYNEMLNAIGIKTLYITGWAFQNDETSGNKDTVGHAWTAALIGDKWVELDATWGLFEGIPAGHVLKGFFTGETTFSFNEDNNDDIQYEDERTIELITDEKDLEDPYPKQPEEEDSEDNDSTEDSSDNKQEGGNSEDSSDNKQEGGNTEDSSDNNQEGGNTEDSSDNKQNDNSINNDIPYFKNISLLSLILLNLFIL